MKGHIFCDIISSSPLTVNRLLKTKLKIRGRNPKANYTDRAPLVSEVSAKPLWVEGCCVVSATNSHRR
jgi:hypothetical protein